MLTYVFYASKENLGNIGTLNYYHCKFVCNTEFIEKSLIFLVSHALKKQLEKNGKNLHRYDCLFSINKSSLFEFLVVSFGVPLILRHTHLMLIHLSISGIETLRGRAVPLCLIRAKWISPNTRPRLNIVRVSNHRLTRCLNLFSRSLT